MQKVENMLSIHLTDLCNNNCKFCIVDSPTQTKEQVSAKRVFAFLEDNTGKNYTAVNLHGGESTTRKDFIDILKKIKRSGYPKTILQTNARKLNDINFAKETIDNNVQLFVVSVHGARSQFHDLITQCEGSLEETIQGIKNVKSLGASVRTNTVVSKMNYKNLVNIVDLVNSLKVDHINISALHTGGAAFRNFEEVTPTYLEIEPYLKGAIDRAVRYGTRLTLEGFPLCRIEGYEQYMIPWDTQKFKMLYRKMVIKDYENYMDALMRVQGLPCFKCKQNKVCGGVYKEYIEFRGWDEFGYRN